MVKNKSRVLSPWLLALGSDSLPPKIIVKQSTYHLQRVFKHDFWAASGLYSNDSSQVVLKIYRRHDLLGRWLAKREISFYRCLQDLPGIARFLGTFGRNGFVHSYIAGQDLLEYPKDRIPDDFFDQLVDLMRAIHLRGISYVDANKRDNVIVGLDSRPYLIDFQISWRPKPGGLSRRVLLFMQRMDMYHLFKHKSRLRPDLMKPQEWHLRRNPGLSLKLHRLIAVPFRRFRRTTLRRLLKSTQLKNPQPPSANPGTADDRCH
ncbi:MAG: hypothetical protein GWP14_01830 [Actinobacteria bacterium]|nr:hypothetical protein [Actinomycetota bacterium]